MEKSENEKADAAKKDGNETIIDIDKAIKHLFSSEKQALIRLINGALGENYDPDTTELIELKTEFLHRRAVQDGPTKKAKPSDLDRIVADIIFTLNGVAYHIEIQTKADRTIAIRIMGYGAGHALSGLRNKGIHDEVVFELPVPVLIQIDKDKNIADKIPAKVKLSGRDDALSFDITVIKLWTYDVKTLLARGFYLLLPFLLAKHRKGKKTEKRVKALISDIHEIEKAISGLYDGGQIHSDLRLNLYETLDSIVYTLNAKTFNNNQEIHEELKKMETTRAVFAQEHKAIGKAEGEAKGRAEGEAKGKAEGKAKGKAESARITKMYLQKKSTKEISKEVGVPLKEVVSFLKESGLSELPQ